MNMRSHITRNIFKTTMCMLLVTVATIVQAQTPGVGIDVPSPDPSAVLDLDDSGNKRGLIVPRVNSTERQAIPSPADGLLVYDTDQKMFYHYDAGAANWQAVNPFSYRKGSSSADEDNFVMTFVNNKSFVIGTVATPTAKLEVGGDIKGSGNMTVSGTATSNAISTASVTATGNITSNGQFIGNGTVPLGGIIMWSGTVPPTGWALCNGQPSNGYTTPDLRGRFIVGYDPGVTDYDQPGNLSRKLTPETAGKTGGAPSVTLSVAQLPSHNHSGATGTDTHSHGFNYPSVVPGTTGLTEGVLVTEDDNENTTGTRGIPDLSLSNNTHAHTIPSEGQGQAHENRPPYYVLAFIMRVQ